MDDHGLFFCAFKREAPHKAGIAACNEKRRQNRAQIAAREVVLEERTKGKFNKYGRDAPPKPRQKDAREMAHCMGLQKKGPGRPCKEIALLRDIFRESKTNHGSSGIQRTSGDAIGANTTRERLSRRIRSQNQPPYIGPIMNVAVDAVGRTAESDHGNRLLPVMDSERDDTKKNAMSGNNTPPCTGMRRLYPVIDRRPNFDGGDNSHPQDSQDSIARGSSEHSESQQESQALVLFERKIQTNTTIAEKTNLNRTTLSRAMTRVAEQGITEDEMVQMYFLDKLASAIKNEKVVCEASVSQVRLDEAAQECVVMDELGIKTAGSHSILQVQLHGGFALRLPSSDAYPDGKPVSVRMEHPTTLMAMEGKA